MGGCNALGRRRGSGWRHECLRDGPRGRHGYFGDGHGRYHREEEEETQCLQEEERLLLRYLADPPCLKKGLSFEVETAPQELAVAPTKMYPPLSTLRKLPIPMAALMTLTQWRH